MKPKLLFLILTLTQYFVCFSQKKNVDLLTMDSLLKARQTEAIGKQFGFFETTYKNLIITNEDLKGKVVFINFWFAACPPCIAELPELNKLYDTLKNNDGFEFISFTFEKQKVIKEIIKKYKIKYKVLSVSPADCNRLINNSSFPSSVLIDKNGIIKFLKAGGSKDKLEIKDIIFNDYYPKILSEINKPDN